MAPRLGGHCQLVDVLVHLARGVHTNLAASDAPSHAEWVQQAGTSALYGSRGPVDPRYWASMRKALGLRKAALPDTCRAALTRTLEDAFAACARRPQSKRCLKRFGVSQPPAFPDANFEIWRSAAMPKITPKQFSRLADRGADLGEADVTKILGKGWVPDLHALRALSRERSE